MASKRLLPPISNLAEIVHRSSLQLQSSEMSTNNAEYIAENKILLQRYFFYNFMISAALTEFIALSKSIGLYPDMHESIFSTLSHLMCQLSTKSLNDSLDEAIINDVINSSANMDRIKQYQSDTAQGSKKTIAL